MIITINEFRKYLTEIMSFPEENFYEFGDDSYKRLSIFDTYQGYNIRNEMNIYYHFDQGDDECGVVEILFRSSSPDYPTVVMIEVNPNKLRQGVGFTMYEWLIKQFGGIYSGGTQTPQSEAVWRKLFTKYSIFAVNTIGKKTLLTSIDQMRSVYNVENKLLFATSH